MLFTLTQSLLSRWATALWKFIRKWGAAVVSVDPSPDIEQGIQCEAQNTAQPNATHLKFVKEAFIDSLQPHAIESLASTYNNQKRCRTFRKENGSFNVCYFVEFPEDGVQWVVRVPIEPALQHPWEKMQSEIATIK